MSLVGPRPHLPEEVAEYKPEWRKVLTVKPGITGMAQVLGRADLNFEDEVRLDTHYIEHWSPWLDLDRHPRDTVGGVEFQRGEVISSPMKIALVHDHLTQDGCAERVLRVLSSLYPRGTDLHPRVSPRAI